MASDMRGMYRCTPLAVFGCEQCYDKLKIETEGKSIFVKAQQDTSNLHQVRLKVTYNIYTYP